jgi:serine/threonine-protein kinase HSL1 (negative regulator of Swe1 kinase)
VAFFVFERSEGGELMDFLMITEAFEEPIARHYFKQLMQGLDFCHINGVAHRDLKPANLLLDKDFILKIADFGNAAPILGRNGEGILKSYCGTENFLAPEIILGKPYRG